ncbi:MAG: pyridoxamine 5'-phosphate oxidase [Povalibacter sp.]
MFDNDFLPEPLPSDPLPLFVSWFREARARAVQPNPDAMVLATVSTDGLPSARVVLCKRVDDSAGYLVFFTNRNSRKGRELDGQKRAAAVIHWDAMHRQVRVEGRVVRAPDQESDEYFASRAVLSRLSAWASEQSKPLASRAEFQQRLEAEAARFGVAPDATTGTVTRPPHWGGYRLWIESLELWIEGPGRSHDRAVWQRSLTPKGEDSFDAGGWTATRLNP